MLRLDSFEIAKTAYTESTISLDTKIGLEYYEDCWDFYKEGLEIFECTLQSLIIELNTAQIENDLNTIKFLMHSLRSIAGYVGAIPLQTIAKKLELASVNLQLDDLDSLIKELLDEITQVQFAVNKLLQN